MCVSRIPRFHRAAALVAVVCLSAAMASAGNQNYPFNSNPGDGWTVVNYDSLGNVVSNTTSLTQLEWVAGPSSAEGGWHTRYGTDAPVAATALESPWFRVDDVDGNYVHVTFTDRFNFPFDVVGSSTIPLEALGQLQVSIKGGAWTGLPTSAFEGTSNHHVPEYTFPTTPTPPLVSETLLPTGTTTSPVQAFIGTTTDFAAGKHHDWGVQMDFPPYTFGPGDFFRLRFVMQIQTSGTDTPPPINWEINNVLVEGIDMVVVPEPGAVTLAGLGAVAAGGMCLWRRRRAGRSSTSA